MSQPAPRIFGYAHATSYRRDQGATVQEEMILAKAKTLEGQWVRCHRDEQTSATDICWSERPEFQKLMHQLEPGDHLIIWRLDRLDRSPLGMVAALEWLVDRGVCVHILEHNRMQIDLDKRAGRLLVMILAEFARLLVDFPREALRESIRWRKECGRACSRVPQLGKCRRYKYTTRGGKRTRVAFDIWDGGECDVIREIWRRHEEGETLYSIAKDLKARDVRRWNGKPWVPDGCRRQPVAGKRYPLNPRTVQRAFWRYTAMLAQGRDLHDMEPAPQHVERAIHRLKKHRLRWTKQGQPGRLPREIRELLERNDREALSEITPRSWGKRLYPGPGQ